MKLYTVLVLALVLAACGSSPVAVPADASQDAVRIVDATDAPTDPCGGLCGAGTACAEGRCVALDAGVDALVDALRPVDAMDVAEDRGSDAPTDTGCPAHADRLPTGGCACVIGYRSCADACVDIDTDPANCGACGNRCAGACAAGRCAVVDAGADAAPDVVCASMTPGNCCGVACPVPATASAATCVAGRCGVVCAALDGVPVYGDCDGMAANGCEVDLRTSAANCGACGAPCGAHRSCRARACSMVCDTGFGDCDRDPSNGCESNFSADANNCGACGFPCAPGRACVGGACAR